MDPCHRPRLWRWVVHRTIHKGCQSFSASSASRSSRASGRSRRVAPPSVNALGIPGRAAAICHFPPVFFEITATRWNWWPQRACASPARLDPVQHHLPVFDRHIGRDQPDIILLAVIGGLGQLPRAGVLAREELLHRIAPHRRHAPRIDQVPIARPEPRPEPWYVVLVPRRLERRGVLLDRGNLVIRARRHASAFETPFAVITQTAERAREQRPRKPFECASASLRAGTRPHATSSTGAQHTRSRPDATSSWVSRS